MIGFIEAFFVQSVLITIIQCYRWFTQFTVRYTRTVIQTPLVVSGQRVSTHELSLQITMKPSCHLLFHHLGLPACQNSNQFSHSICSVLSSYKQTLVTQTWHRPHRKHLLLLPELLCSLATSYNMIHRDHSSHCFVFTGTVFTELLPSSGLIRHSINNKHTCSSSYT
jgi:hypothetical protein